MIRCDRIREEERAQALRREVMARQKGLCHRADTDLVRDADLRRRYAAETPQLRAGLICRDRLSSLEFEVGDQALLAGRLRVARERYSEAEWAAADADNLRAYQLDPGQTGHCELDFSLWLQGGLCAVRQRLAGAHAAAGDAEAVAFYTSALTALDGLENMLRNLRRCLEDRVAGERNERRREELAAMLRSVARLAAGEAPRDFLDAVHVVWLGIVAVMAGDNVWLIQPGRLDRILWPFFATVGEDLALALLEGLYFELNAFDRGGVAYGVMAGGSTADGGAFCNRLSYLTLEAMRRTRLVYPTVGLCHHPELPSDLIDLAVELIGMGISNVAFFGDATIRRGLEHYGVPPRESHLYINSTCVEITPCYSSGVWVASPYFNLCKALLRAIEQAAAGGAGAESFAAFRRATFDILGAEVAETAREEDTWRRWRRERGQRPLQSVFTRDCVERGRDLTAGGARYNWVECSFVGLANLVDSLEVVREEVFHRGNLTFAELHAVLDADYRDAEACRQKFLHACPKYGNGEERVDALVPEVMAELQRICGAHRMAPDDSPYIPGTFCFVVHQLMGAETGATPDGRHAGEAFADGAGPAQGRERSGPTAAVFSTSSWNQENCLGGVAFNLKFNPEPLRTRAGRKALRELLLTYLARGGFEVQVNVFNPVDLSCDGADCVVRIGGYTDYFQRLSPGMKKEVLARMAFESI